MIDHLVWGAPDLTEACDMFERLTGVAPVFGGRHTLGGTWNALVSLGERQYLEIIAPNPEEPVSDSWRDALEAMPVPAMFKLCISPDQGLDKLAVAARAAGISGQGPYEDGRVAPDGTRLRWRLFMPNASELPFFIDWLDTPHPSSAIPHSGCGLVDCWIEHPAADREFIAQTTALSAGIAVIDGHTHAIRARLNTPRGTITL